MWNIGLEFKLSEVLLQYFVSIFEVDHESFFGFSILRSRLQPLFDVWHLSNSAHKVGNFGVGFNNLGQENYTRPPLKLYKFIC